MSQLWRTKEWREKRAEYIKGKSCEWCGSTETLSVHHPQPRLSISDEEYLSFKDTIILCKRCHGAFYKGFHLCPKCKKKYVPNRFQVCFDCLPIADKKRIDARKSEQEALEREDEKDEVPLIEITLPCGLKAIVYSDMWEWGGVVETCLHQCPDPKIGGDVNNCESFKNYNKEEHGS